APATAPAAAAPAPRARDEVRLARGAGAPEPAITRWTERPERSPEDRPEDELTPVSPVPLPPEGRAPLNDEGGSRMAGPDAVTDPPAAAPPAPAAAPAPAETPTPPPRTGPPEESALNPAPAPPRRMSVTSDEHDTFFTRGSDVKEIEALLDKNAAADAEESNKRLFLYVSAGVGTVALLLVLLFLSSAPPAAPTAEAPPVAEPAPAAPTPNVVIPDMGAQVKSQQEAAAELVRHDTTEPAASAAPPKSAAELAGELAAEKPAVAAVQPAPVPAKPVEQPVVAPVAAKPVEKPAEKPADDPKRLFADRFEKGKKLLDQEKYEDAKKAFESALKFDPGSARAYAQLGRVQYELGNQDEALRQLRKAEALDASHSYTHLVMGMLLQERGDLPGAEKAYEKYLALDSTSGNARAVQGFLKALRAQRAAKK
ncbi:MAG: tetratricopeptide repeat protein, partial [Deltaproteobacteria bacterium]|nr:tetratricopeptide repeat protein [Deltaproteobacteria bacterium]